uniref:Uncharacterized protein n=1 Tax=Rhizophora mucronata TaxID=61149 RepID=A0A2P2NXA2_RHIMU
MKRKIISPNWHISYLSSIPVKDRDI